MVYRGTNSFHQITEANRAAVCSGSRSPPARPQSPVLSRRTAGLELGSTAVSSCAPRTHWALCFPQGEAGLWGEGAVHGLRVSVCPHSFISTKVHGLEPCACPGSGGCLSEPNGLRQRRLGPAQTTRKTCGKCPNRARSHTINKWKRPEN